MNSSGNQVSLLQVVKRRKLKLQMKAMIQRQNHNQQEEIHSILTLTNQTTTLKIQMMICLIQKKAIKRKVKTRNFFKREEEVLMSQVMKIAKLLFKKGEIRKKLALNLHERTVTIEKIRRLKILNQSMMMMTIKMKTKMVQLMEKKRSWQEREGKVHVCKQKKSLGLQSMSLKKGASLIKPKQEEAIKSMLKAKEKRRSDQSMLEHH